MKYRKLSESGDYTFGGNMQDFLTGPEAVAQAIRTKLLLFYYEWWEDLGQGIPMFQSFLGQPGRQKLADGLQQLVSKRVREVPEIKNVSKVEITMEYRKIFIYIKCSLLDDEEVEVEVAV